MIYLDNMEAKLVKHEVDYYCLLNNKGEVIADVNGGDISKLSLKNCEAIANGYDLDELADNSVSEWNSDVVSWGEPSLVIEHDGSYKHGFRDGFQKALEVNADKRFTLKEMLECWNRALEFQTHKETLGEYIKSLKQTEWDVEIVTEEILVDFNDEGQEQYVKQPKLDEKGRLILKRK